jgi:hypothetical protein
LIASPGASATCRISFAPCRRAALSLKAIEQPIDTSTAAGKCFLDILGVFAEFETNLRRERQLEGIAKAKAAGVYKGRPATIEAARVRELKAGGMRPTRQGAQDRLGLGFGSSAETCFLRCRSTPLWSRRDRCVPEGGAQKRVPPLLDWPSINPSLVQPRVMAETFRPIGVEANDKAVVIPNLDHSPVQKLFGVLDCCPVIGAINDRRRSGLL